MCFSTTVKHKPRVTDVKKEFASSLWEKLTPSTRSAGWDDKLVVSHTDTRATDNKLWSWGRSFSFFEKFLLTCSIVRLCVFPNERERETDFSCGYRPKIQVSFVRERQVECWKSCIITTEVLLKENRRSLPSKNFEFFYPFLKLWYVQVSCISHTLWIGGMISPQIETMCCIRNDDNFMFFVKQAQNTISTPRIKHSIWKDNIRSILKRWAVSVDQNSLLRLDMILILAALGKFLKVPVVFEKQITIARAIRAVGKD